MNTRAIAPSFLVTLSALGLAACDFEKPATQAEMREAVVEVAELGDGVGAQAEIIELTTSFTLGQGVQATMEEIRDFVRSQVPCSTVTLEPGQLAIDFGDLGDACVYRGRTYAGVVTVSYEPHEGGAQITHTYEDLTGGRVTMDGTAEVTWTGNERHIVTDLDFVRDDDHHVHVEADRTQTFRACEDAAAVCVHVEGTRQWTSPRGTWDLLIDDIEARSIDPVPESGRYEVTNPAGRVIEMGFSRLDEDTIAVDITGGRRDVTFEVTAAGQVR